MSASRWQRVQELFAWALEREPGARGAGLLERCAGDAELRHEVESLLAAATSPFDFLEMPAADRIVAWDDGDPRRGTRIGHYRLERPLGRGGMGVVYEAWQDDPRRAVALKVVRGGALADPLRVRRFQREADSLGRLAHPGIARIFEAGLDAESGDHWFAMELIRGQPLVEFARSAGATRATLLDLFVQICRAVDHAHHHGVIHRDLKPSNVLVVTDEPEKPLVKVLDFGLAHYMAVESAGSTRLTEPGRVSGTLAYMSPEQARGDRDAIGPRSDVYSLGVILHELLTDRLPLEVDGLELPAAALRISADVPEHPSRMDRALRGDLDTIVMKALEKDPARRYASASALALDVELWLAGRPIVARPPSFAYQTRKLVLRHKLFFASVFLLCLISAAAAVVTNVLYVRTRTAEQHARSEARSAQEINAFLQDMLSSAGPGARSKRELTVREVLDRAAARIAREPFSAPEVATALHATIGDAYRALGIYDRAEAHLETALAAHRGDPVDGAALVRDQVGLGQVRLAQARYPEAEELFRQAIEELRRSGPPLSLAGALASRASAIRLGASSAQALAEARLLYEESLAIVHSLPDQPAPELEADIENEYAGVLAAQGDNAASEERYRRALELHRRALGDSDSRIAQDENDLAIVLARGDRLDEAIALTRHALATYEQALGREHPITVAVVNNLGALLVKGPQMDEGMTLLAEALEVRRKILGPDHPDVARTLMQLAQVALRRNELDSARACLEEALEIDRTALGPFHMEVASGETSLGALELAAGDPEAALEHACLALEINRRVLPADHVFIPQSEGLLGRVLLALGRLDEAEELLTSSASTLEAAVGAGHPATQQALGDLRALRLRRGELERSEKLAPR